MVREEIIVKAKKDFEFLKDEVLGIVMFGSIVKGNSTERSDVDICIIAPGKDLKKL